MACWSDVLVRSPITLCSGMYQLRAGAADSIEGGQRPVTAAPPFLGLALLCLGWCSVWCVDAIVDQVILSNFLINSASIFWHHIDWWIHRFIDRSIDWLIVRLIASLLDLSIDWVARLIDRLVYWLIDRWTIYRCTSNLCACLFCIPPSSKSNCILDVKVQKSRFRFPLWIMLFCFLVCWLVILGARPSSGVCYS